MKTSENGINLIKEFEGCRLAAYQDPVGVWTIGYGHTAGVKQGDTISQEQADAYLSQDLETAELAVSSYDYVYHWNQNQFDALVSFSYNLGPGAIAQVTGAGSRDKDTIAEKMLLYYNAGGKKLEGLVRRRQAEHDLFVKPIASGQFQTILSLLEELRGNIIRMTELYEEDPEW